MGLGLALSDRRTLPWDRLWGGSMAIVDSERRTTVVHVMNRVDSAVLGSGRAEEYVTAIHRAGARPQK